MINSRLPNVGVALLLVLLTGCSQTLLLKSQFVATTQEEPPAEVVETPAYRTSSGGVRTVAVRAPDSCADQTAAISTGEADSKETVLKTSCGVEMAEVERVLAKHGYRVISWNILSREMSTTNKSAGEIASGLGAEVIFQVNSLEKSRKSLGKDARWDRTYYESNAKGARLKPKAFNDETRDWFKTTYLQPYEQTIRPRLAVTLDASAVLVKTGEAIWYYRWTHADPSAVEYGTEVFVKCSDVEDPEDRRCTSFTPKGLPGKKTETVSATESEAISVAGGPANEENAEYKRLLSEVTADLVRNFAKVARY